MEQLKKTDVMKLTMKCYQAYQLFWMISQGYTLEDVIKGLVDAEAEHTEDDYPKGTVEDIMTEFFEEFEEVGFGSGTMYVCYHEFMDAEFRDFGFMEQLTNIMGPQAKEMYKKYFRNFFEAEEIACADTCSDIEYALYEDLNKQNIEVYAEMSNNKDFSKWAKIVGVEKEYVIFTSAEDMMAQVEDNTDFFNEYTGMYMFRYSESGDVAYYYLDVKQAMRLSDECQDEYWGSGLGPGGYIVEEPTADFFEELWNKDGWVVADGDYCKLY